MDSNQKFNIAWKKIKEQSDALFGKPEELTDAEADEMLRAAEIDLVNLKRDTYERLYREAQSYWMEKKDPPDRLKKALEALRPMETSQAGSPEIQRQAKSVLDTLLQPFRTPIVGATLSYSYRGKKYLSSEDQAALSRLREKLRRRVVEDSTKEGHE